MCALDREYSGDFLLCEVSSVYFNANNFQRSFSPHNIEHVSVIECKQNRGTEKRKKILQSTALYDKL